MRPPRLHRPSRHASVTQPASLPAPRLAARLLVGALLIGAGCAAGCQSKDRTPATGPGGAGASDDRVPPPGCAWFG